MKLFSILFTLFFLSGNIFSQGTVVTPSEEPNRISEDEIKKTKNDTKEYVADYYNSERRAAYWYIFSGATSTALGLYYRREYDNYVPNPVQIPFKERNNDFPYTTIGLPIQTPFNEKDEGPFEPFGLKSKNGPDFPHFGGKDNPHFSLGFSYPMLGVGIFHLGSGLLMYFNSESRKNEAHNSLDSDLKGFKEDETKRLKKLEQYNTYLGYFNWALVGSGAYATLAGIRNDSEYMKGLGFGLLIQGGLSILLDKFVYKNRLAEYKSKIDSINVNFSYIPSSRGANSYSSLLSPMGGGVAGEGIYSLSAVIRF
jgi:hypothetical protein